MRELWRGADRDSGQVAHDLPGVIDQLADELTAAMERVAGGVDSEYPSGRDQSFAGRLVAYQVLSHWLRSNRSYLSDPAEADAAVASIRAALRLPEVLPLGHGFKEPGESIAAERLAISLGDGFTRAMVWVAEGLDAQLGFEHGKTS